MDVEWSWQRQDRSRPWCSGNHAALYDTLVIYITYVLYILYILTNVSIELQQQRRGEQCKLPASYKQVTSKLNAKGRASSNSPIQTMPLACPVSAFGCVGMKVPHERRKNAYRGTQGAERGMWIGSFGVRLRLWCSRAQKSPSLQKFFPGHFVSRRGGPLLYPGGRYHGIAQEKKIGKAWPGISRSFVRSTR